MYFKESEILIIELETQDILQEFMGLNTAMDWLKDKFKEKDLPAREQTIYNKAQVFFAHFNSFKNNIEQYNTYTKYINAIKIISEGILVLALVSTAITVFTLSSATLVSAASIIGGIGWLINYMMDKVNEILKKVNQTFILNKINHFQKNIRDIESKINKARGEDDRLSLAISKVDTSLIKIENKIKAGEEASFSY